jgi:hypothetical protein
MPPGGQARQATVREPCEVPWPSQHLRGLIPIRTEPPRLLLSLQIAGGGTVAMPGADLSWEVHFLEGGPKSGSA